MLEDAEQHGANERLAQLRAAVASAQEALDGLRPSPEQLRAEAAEAERLARESGTSAKTGAVVAAMKRRWMEFLAVHGEAYEFDGTPTIELAIKFQTHGFKERVNWSTFGCDGMGDSWGALQVPYLLAKYVFPRLEYPGWSGLTLHALAASSSSRLCLALGVAA